MDMNILEQAINGIIDRKLAQPSRQGVGSPGRSLAKGLLAGLAAGLAATAVKTVADQLFPARIHGEPEATEVLSEKIAGHELAPTPKAVASQSIHWIFGTAAGTAYGAIAEFYPIVTTRDGADFGLVLMALTQESALPAMGLAAALTDQSTRQKSSEAVSHIVYGIVAETTRRLVRKAL